MGVLDLKSLPAPQLSVRDTESALGVYQFMDPDIPFRDSGAPWFMFYVYGFDMLDQIWLVWFWYLIAYFRLS